MAFSSSATQHSPPLGCEKTISGSPNRHCDGMQSSIGTDAQSLATASKKRTVYEPVSERPSSWMVKRGENVNLGGLWQKGHGLSVGSEAKRPSSRVRRAASSLQMQSHEPLLASCGGTKTATLTMLIPP